MVKKMFGKNIIEEEHAQKEELPTRHIYMEPPPGAKEIGGQEMEINVEDELDQYTGLNKTQFDVMFKKHSASATHLKKLWGDYQANKKEPTIEMLPMIEDIEAERKKMFESIRKFGIDPDSLTPSQIELLSQFESRSMTVPIGILENINEIKRQEQRDKNGKLKSPISALPDKVYLNMLMEDCNIEIQDFLSTFKLYPNFLDFVNNFNPNKYNMSGYESSLTFVRELLGIDEPERCAYYEFNEDNIRKLLENETNDQFYGILKGRKLNQDFDDWVMANWPENLPEEIEKSAGSISGFVNVARIILGMEPEKIPDTSTSRLDIAEKNVIHAISLLQEIDPTYNLERVDPTKLGFKEDEKDLWVKETEHLIEKEKQENTKLAQKYGITDESTTVDEELAEVEDEGDRNFVMPHGKETSKVPLVQPNEGATIELTPVGKIRRFIADKMKHYSQLNDDKSKINYLSDVDSKLSKMVTQVDITDLDMIELENDVNYQKLMSEWLQYME